MEGWKENLPNQTGKEILIKAIIQVVPSYTISIVRFPKNFCQGICSAVVNFWWRGNGHYKGIHWKIWNLLTTRKTDGGMGFRDLSLMNSVLLAKQA